MNATERDDIPMLPAVDVQLDDRTSREFSIRRRSASMPVLMSSLAYSEIKHSVVGFTNLNKRQNPTVQISSPLFVNHDSEFIFQPPQDALRQTTNEPEIQVCPENNDRQLNDYVPKNEHLLKSGHLGMCSDPNCINCPMVSSIKGCQKHSRPLDLLEAKFNSKFYEDAKGWGKRMSSSLCRYMLGVMNPHTKVVQQWNKFVAVSCLFALFFDPLSFFLLSVQRVYRDCARLVYLEQLRQLPFAPTELLVALPHYPKAFSLLVAMQILTCINLDVLSLSGQDKRCIVLNWPITILILKSMTDFIYLLHVILQFRLAYVALGSTGSRYEYLVDDPKSIAKNYFCGYFMVDLLVVLPLTQIVILLSLRDSMGGSLANHAAILLPAVFCVHHVPRFCRFLPLVAGSSPTGFIFESSWANFVINLVLIVLVSNLVGSLWYLFGVQRVSQCFRDACYNSNITMCMEFIDCGHGNAPQWELSNDPNWEVWRTNENATACFGGDAFKFGIFDATVNLTSHRSVGIRYAYSVFWGTLGGNLVPSYYLPEVLFTVIIIATGVVQFALLIGNIQHFSQALGRRRLEIYLRRRDVDEWMHNRRLPEELRRQVQASEQFTWATTRGINEETLMEKFPEDLQREIKLHLFKLVKKVRIFQHLDEPIVDAICQRLKTKLYIKGSKISTRGCLVDKMVFVIRGEMESIGEDGTVIPLSEGDVCGEELLTWYLQRSSNNKDGKRIRISGQKLLSNKLVRCLTNVEAFILQGADLEHITNLFLTKVMRYESPFWKGLAVRRIRIARRNRKKCANQSK
ncbi:hypothetical protein OROHE_008201 [Orobanche hederae]